MNVSGLTQEKLAEGFGEGTAHRKPPNFNLGCEAPIV